MGDPLMQFFGYTSLPPHLQGIGVLFHSLAQTLVDTLPRNAERTVGLRKLLESRDAMIRARNYIEPYSV